MKIIEKIVSIDTNKETIIERDMTPAEIAQSKIDEANAKAFSDEQAAKETAKQAVLAKLGLTADEVAALLS